LRGKLVLHRRRKKGVLNATAKLGLQGRRREQGVLNATTKLRLQGRRCEQWVLKATTKLGLQGRRCKQRVLNATTKLGLQGRGCEQRVLNATTKLGLQGRCCEQRVLNATTELGLQGRCCEQGVLNATAKLGLQGPQREKRVLNATALQGSREERVLGCHSSQAISLRGIVRHHKLVLLYYCCLQTRLVAGRMSRRPQVRTTAIGLTNRWCHRGSLVVCADCRIFGKCRKWPRVTHTRADEALLLVWFFTL
jgi:hypothetical protein